MKVVFGRSGCVACEMVKQKYKVDGTQYKYIDIDTMKESTLDQLIDANNKRGGGNALPIVFEDDEINYIL